MVSGRAWERTRQGGCPWPGLWELSWNRRGVPAADWAGCRASRPPSPPHTHTLPKVIAWSSGVTPRPPQLPACPLCLWLQARGGRGDLSCTPGIHSTARAQSSTSAPCPRPPLSPVTPSSAPLSSGVGSQLSGSLGPQSGGRQDPELNCRSKGDWRWRRGRAKDSKP